jgi:monoamine oxidase
VLIVGAGLSGLACAVHLKQQGHLPLVVEARERVGGRVLTFRDFAPGRTVEGGGELVGSNHPLWVALAQRFGLEFGEVTEPEELDYPLRVDGRTVRGGEADRIWAELEEFRPKSLGRPILRSTGDPSATGSAV